MRIISMGSFLKRFEGRFTDVQTNLHEAGAYDERQRVSTSKLRNYIKIISLTFIVVSTNFQRIFIYFFKKLNNIAMLNYYMSIISLFIFDILTTIS